MHMIQYSGGLLVQNGNVSNVVRKSAPSFNPTPDQLPNPVAAVNAPAKTEPAAPAETPAQVAAEAAVAAAKEADAAAEAAVAAANAEAAK
jgi:hypothetical protein